MNATCVPSGENVGSASRNPSLVSRTTAPVASVLTKMSWLVGKHCETFSGPQPTYTIFLPSRDQDASVWLPGCAVSATGLRPLTSTVQICELVCGPATTEIFVPSGDHSGWPSQYQPFAP